MAELDPLDREILYFLLEAEKKRKAPVSAWQLASKKANNTAEINSLEGVFRYRLEKLAKKGLVEKRKYKKGKTSYTGYKLSQKNLYCVNGSLILIANPILVLECPYINKCRSKCRIDFYKLKGKTVIRGCKLLQEAPEHIRQLVLKHLETTL